MYLHRQRHCRSVSLATYTLCIMHSRSSVKLCERYSHVSAGSCFCGLPHKWVSNLTAMQHGSARSCLGGLSSVRPVRCIGSRLPAAATSSAHESDGIHSTHCYDSAFSWYAVLASKMLTQCHDFRPCVRGTDSHNVLTQITSLSRVAPPNCQFSDYCNLP